MHRTFSFFVATIVLASLSCTATIAPPFAASPLYATQPVRAAAAPRPVAAPPVAAYGPGEDAHWVQADDYFVAKTAHKGGWIYVWLGKMKQPPTAETKGEAMFFMVHNGTDLWSANFYRTRPVVESDLVMGNLLICFDSNKQQGVHRGPRNKDNARPGGWWLARITDLSDMYKGYATLSGRYHCAPDALRALVQ